MLYKVEGAPLGRRGSSGIKGGLSGVKGVKVGQVRSSWVKYICNVTDIAQCYGSCEGAQWLHEISGGGWPSFR